MGLLLYKSDEMYSSTELIRKSKIIFDKISERKIGKAVILEEGRPCFLLMDFKKYEEIISEYEELKGYVTRLKERSKMVHEAKKNAPTQPSLRKEEVPLAETPKKITPTPAKPIQTAPVQKEHKQEPRTLQQTQQTQQNTLTEEQEIKNALKSIENMNFDDDMKLEAELKIKTRILQARAERLKVLEDEEELQEQRKKDLLLQSQIQEIKIKKDRELREFWD